MSLAYIDITDLKNERADSGKYLRWVESMLSWYMSSPTSTASGDDNAVVIPNLGVGRWLKQDSLANTGQSFTTFTLNSNTTLSAWSKNYCNTTSGSIVLTLPASPISGTLINIYAYLGTSLTNKITINPNGSNINGITSNVDIIELNVYVDLEFLSGVGWLIKNKSSSNALRLASSTTPYSINDPSTLPNYSGLINYLGTQKNTVSYQNPTNGASGRQIRCVTSKYKIEGEATISGGQSSIVSGLFDKTVNDNYTYTDISNIGGSGGVWIDFLDGLVRAKSIQISIRSASNRWLNRPSTLLIYGANTFNPSFLSTYSYGISTANNRNLTIDAGFTDLELLTIDNNLGNPSVWTISGSNYHYLIPVNSLKYYRHYIIYCPEPKVSGALVGYFFVGALEFFGDIVV